MSGQTIITQYESDMISMRDEIARLKAELAEERQQSRHESLPVGTEAWIARDIDGYVFAHMQEPEYRDRSGSWDSEGKLKELQPGNILHVRILDDKEG